MPSEALVQPRFPNARTGEFFQEGFRIFRMHADHKAGVGKRGIPPGQGHAVDNHLVIFRSGLFFFIVLKR